MAGFLASPVMPGDTTIPVVLADDSRKTEMLIVGGGRRAAEATAKLP
jgi:hypothetical protein